MFWTSLDLEVADRFAGQSENRTPRRRKASLSNLSDRSPVSEVSVPHRGELRLDFGIGRGRCRQQCRLETRLLVLQLTDSPLSVVFVDPNRQRWWSDSGSFFQRLKQSVADVMC